MDYNSALLSPNLLNWLAENIADIKQRFKYLDDLNAEQLKEYIENKIESQTECELNQTYIPLSESHLRQEQSLRAKHEIIMLQAYRRILEGPSQTSQNQAASTSNDSDLSTIVTDIDQDAASMDMDEQPVTVSNDMVYQPSKASINANTFSDLFFVDTLPDDFDLIQHSPKPLLFMPLSQPVASFLSDLDEAPDANDADQWLKTSIQLD